MLFATVLVSLALFNGCAGPKARTSKYMAAEASAPTSPPSGKVLVCIHRPKAYFGCKLYSSVWDGTKFIADLGNGHSVAYVCDPGEHYFLNRSAEEQGCVEAQLLPDQTYDLWVKNGYGTWVASFKLVPVDQNQENRQKVAEWTQKNRWVSPASPSEAYEAKKQEEVKQLLDEFISGRRHDKLQQLSADDHR